MNMFCSKCKQNPLLARDLTASLRENVKKRCYSTYTMVSLEKQATMRFIYVQYMLLLLTKFKVTPRLYFLYISCSL